MLNPDKLFCNSQLNFTLTVQALDFVSYEHHNEIDDIVKNIPFQANKNEVKIEEVGTNGIGLFDLTYQMQNLDTL